MPLNRVRVRLARARASGNSVIPSSHNAKRVKSGTDFRLNVTTERSEVRATLSYNRTNLKGCPVYNLKGAFQQL